MTTIQVSAAELKELDPKRFWREYYEWCSAGVPDDWPDFHFDGARERLKAKGVDVEVFSYDADPWDAHVSSGYVNAAQFMEIHGLDQQFLPLYLACQRDGSTLQLSRNGFRYGYQRIKVSEAWWNTEPPGVFEGLEQEAWEALLTEQEYACDLEERVLQVVKDECATLASDLEDDYEALTSAEAFIESCDINEITFEVEVEDEVQS